MGNLVFQATLGGQVNLVGPNTASTYNINVPSVNGNLVTTGDTGTVTNTMLAGSIANAKLTNSSVTVGSTSIALGATSTTLDGVNIGATTAGTGAFTTLSASSTVSGTGFSTYLASPPAIGGTTAAAGTFTTLSGTTSVTTPIVKSASSLTLQSNGTTTAVTIDTSQNVGIGTSSPSGKLEIKAVSASQRQLQLTNFNSTDGWYFTADDTGGVLKTSRQGSSGLNGEAMRIDSSGNLMVGTTTAGGIFTAVQSSASTTTLRANATNASYTNDLIQAACATAAGTGFLLYSGYASSTSLVYAVRGNGNVINTNNSYGAISDISLKENIVDATSKLNDLMQVKIRNYNLKADETKTKQIGVVAQELEQVFPAMVEEDKDGIKSVKYSVFVPMLVKAIQELKAQNDTLIARVVALEAK
jgi:hypothetical protein